MYFMSCIALKKLKITELINTPIQESQLGTGDINRELLGQSKSVDLSLQDCYMNLY